MTPSMGETDTAREIATALVVPDSVRTMRVLAAEDNPVFQAMLKTMLTKWGYQAVIARNGNEACRVLEGEDPPRLAILDWMMPGMDGVEICRKLRSSNREPYIYILLLTARTEAQDLIEGMNAGADDYLTKPFNAHELRVRLNAGRRILDLQEELVRTREALRQQATHDGLTGLLNRTAILDRLDNELARSHRSGDPVSAVMVDLDRFKLINDTRGHLAGDAVLRETARRLKGIGRRYDSVGRYGGEEFLIVLPGCDARTAEAQAERIREAVGGEAFPGPGQPFFMTASLGVASNQDHPPEVLIREADDALYAAKAGGRNRVVVHSPGWKPGVPSALESRFATPSGK
ncbi:MAG: diguanylate cyclase [Candidatus Solibacter sp.]